MKTYTTDQLSELEPELFKKIREGHKLIIPEIQPHVNETLSGTSDGSVAVHATFLRITNDESNEIYFLEIQTKFMKFGDDVIYNLHIVGLYDNFDEYETARKKMIHASVNKNGNEMFPTWQHFGGKNVGKIL